MTDIVTDLRDYAERTFCSALLEDAADEIERLRAFLAETIDSLGDPVYELGWDKMDQLVAELGADFCKTLKWYSENRFRFPAPLPSPQSPPTGRGES